MNTNPIQHVIIIGKSLLHYQNSYVQIIVLRNNCMTVKTKIKQQLYVQLITESVVSGCPYWAFKKTSAAFVKQISKIHKSELRSD